MAYTGVRYVIEPGDTLWDIAARKLGDPHAWPRLYAFNNRADVVGAGATRITDPDAIQAGRAMMLPVLPGVPVPPAPPAPRPPSVRALGPQVPQIRMPVRVAYDIRGQTLVLDYGIYIARIRQTGTVMIDLGAPVPLTMVLDGTTELSSESRARTALTTLLSKTSVSFDERTRSVTFGSELILSASNIHGPQTAIAVEGSSTSMMPVFKVSYVYPEIRGHIGPDSYTTMDYRIEIEIEPRAPTLRFQPIRAGAAPRLPSVDLTGLMRNPVIVTGVIVLVFALTVYFTGGLSLLIYAKTATAILIGAATTSLTILR